MALTSHVNEAAFTSRRSQDWNDLDILVRRANAHHRLKGLSHADVTRLSPLYRDVCADLAAAQAARYSAPLIDSLQALTASAHTIVYGVNAKSPSSRLRMKSIVLAFPRAVRRHRLAMAISFLLFFVPFFAALFVSLRDPTFAFRVCPESQLQQLTESYSQGFSAGREAGQGAMMAGFYVNNNVGIALRCFATGIFFGLGSAFYLIQNGFSTGAIIGYVASQGAGANILTFVVGHSTFELGAIVIAGGAGLAVGWSLVAPGDKTRIASLRNTGKDAAILAGGAAAMLFIAAAIEAFWSASSVPAEIKRTVGAVALLIVVGFLVLGGRSRPDEFEARS